MPGAGLNNATDRKASPERSALKPYRGKPAVRIFRGGYGNGGIIRSPLSAMTLLDQQLWTTFQILQGLPTDQLALSVQKIPSSNAIEIGQTMQAVGRE
jgi:hypothetical protein